MKKRAEQLSGSDREEKPGGGAAPGTRGSDIPMRAGRGEIRLAWLLRALILLTAVGHVAQGAVLYVILCLVAVALVVLPAWIARSSAANLPVEIELVLLWWLVADMTLGRLAALYDTSVWYDKALHLGNSVLLGMLGFLAVYVLQFMGKFSAGKIVTGVIIVILTLGIGAFWEILEYLSDVLFAKGAQGSPLQSPLDDTMWDLILDGVGGVIGGLLGPIYMRHSKRSRCRMRAFAEIVAGKVPARGHLHR
jgi:hypothetical protein